MSINLTDELLAKTKKGKIASAKQVFLDGDQENLQQIGDKTHQLEDAIKDITVSGGASTANAVSYNNETSGMTAITAQGAIDELAAKNKAQDTIIEAKAEKSDVQASVSELKKKDSALSAELAKKANAEDVSSQMRTEQARVNAELAKKFNSENIAQESGESEDKVMSQKVVSDKLCALSDNVFGVTRKFTISKKETTINFEEFKISVGDTVKIEVLSEGSCNIGILKQDGSRKWIVTDFTNSEPAYFTLKEGGVEAFYILYTGNDKIDVSFSVEKVFLQRLLK